MTEQATLPDLPNGWYWSTLDSFMDSIEAGKNFKCIEHPPADDETGVVKISAVTWGTFDENESKTCPTEAFLDKRMLVKPGDFLFTRANTLQLVGACVIVDKVSKRLMLSDKVLRLGIPVSWRKWMLYALRSSWGRSEIETLATGNQLSMRNIGQDRIRAIRVPVPPFAEQQRIVAAIEEQLSRLDAAVAGLARVRANLKRYRAAVLQAACEGRLVPTEAELARAEGRPYEPAQVLMESIHADRTLSKPEARTGKIVAAETRGHLGAVVTYPKPATLSSADLPPIPEGWQWASVRQIAEVRLGRQRSPQNRSSQYPTKYIRAANLTWMGLDLHDVLEMDFKPDEFVTYRLVPGDIVLSEASGSADQVGKPAIWRGQLDNCCFQNTVIRCRVRVMPPDYLLTVFLHYALNGVFSRRVRGVGIHHLGAEGLANTPVPLPPVAEQARIVDETQRRLSIADELAASVEASLNRAARLRQAILKRAIKGKLVPQDPSDQSASQLIETIHADRAEGRFGRRSAAAQPRLWS